MNKILEYTVNNKRKLGFSTLIGILVITGLISTYGAIFGVSMPFINGATTVSGILAGLLGKSWKDYFKVQIGDTTITSDNIDEAVENIKQMIPESPKYVISDDELQDVELAEEEADEGV